MANNKIAVFARGRPKGLSLQVTGLLLLFGVNKVDGKYKLELEDKQRVFPSIFSRQLDHLKVCNNTLIMVQDTPDDMDTFEAYAIETKEMRRDKVNLKHSKHLFNKEQ